MIQKKKQITLETILKFMTEEFARMNEGLAQVNARITERFIRMDRELVRSNARMEALSRQGDENFMTIGASFAQINASLTSIEEHLKRIESGAGGELDRRVTALEEWRRRLGS